MDNEEKIVQIPYVVHEAAMARMSAAVKRMFIALLILLALLVVSNAMWIHQAYQVEING